MPSDLIKPERQGNLFKSESLIVFMFILFSMEALNRNMREREREKKSRWGKNCILDT